MYLNKFRDHDTLAVKEILQLLIFLLVTL